MDIQKIKELALANGFSLKEQASGNMDLHSYVYEFANAIEQAAKDESHKHAALYQFEINHLAQANQEWREKAAKAQAVPDGFVVVPEEPTERKFRIKPHTISINGIEVPAPFLPEERELFYHIYPEYEKGYAVSVAHERNKTTWQQFGAWRTEEEIKQVIAAHRQVFDVKPSNCI